LGIACSTVRRLTRPSRHVVLWRIDSGISISWRSGKVDVVQSACPLMSNRMDVSNPTQKGAYIPTTTMMEHQASRRCPSCLTQLLPQDTKRAIHHKRHTKRHLVVSSLDVIKSARKKLFLCLSSRPSHILRPPIPILSRLLHHHGLYPCSSGGRPT